MYPASSLKPSLFTPIGHWFGFTGYYNPFTAEAQLKTDIPVFIKPFVISHEIAHQIGYAKENEASFVGYLACKSFGNNYFLYSAYFELYKNALYECRQSFGKATADSILGLESSRVKWDTYQLKQYAIKNRNPIEPVMSAFYDKYLKLNNQPNGKATYNEVTAYLIAYLKKFGTANL